LLKKPVMVCSHRATLNADARMVLDRYVNRERPPAQRVRSPAQSRSSFDPGKLTFITSEALTFPR
jgi:hypothetical protein